MTNVNLLPVSPFNLDWQYAFGKPLSTAIFKQQPDDFKVVEDIGFEPCGSGEHIYLWIEKSGLNTAYVAEQLAKYTGLPLRQISYAGRKDKHALTRQWFSIHSPKELDVNIEQFTLPGLTLLTHERHNKKLRTGTIASNQFFITLRQVSNLDQVVDRLQQVKALGVPNYFGEQRFGLKQYCDDNGAHRVELGGTLQLGLAMLHGEKIRNRNKRNLALSALRSAVFNALVGERIMQGQWNTVMHGDACQLSGSNSFFCETGDSINDSQQRYDEGDISPTLPLIGTVQSGVSGDSLSWEKNQLIPYQDIHTLMNETGVEAARRAIKLRPLELEWSSKADTLSISFSLPSGCFATAVLRECVQLIYGSDLG